MNGGPLTDEDRIAGFRKATCSMQGAARRWKERAEKGLSDEQLADALAFELGIMGGTGQGPLTIWFQGAGLKIWISREGISPRHDKPTFGGKTTIAMARLVYGIKDPADMQMALF